MRVRPKILASRGSGRYRRAGYALVSPLNQDRNIRMKCSHCNKVVLGATLVSDSEIRCSYCHNLLEAPHKTNLQEIVKSKRGNCPYCGEFNQYFKHTPGDNTLICRKCGLSFDVEVKGLTPKIETLRQDVEILLKSRNYSPPPTPRDYPTPSTPPPHFELRNTTINGPPAPIIIPGRDIACCPPAPAIIITWRKAIYTLIGLGLLFTVLSWLVFQWRGTAALLFVGQMTLLTITICLTPTISYYLTKRRGRVARVVVETLLFAVLLFSFGFWLFGSAVFGIWIAYAMVLILLLEIGGHFVNYQKIGTLQRLTKSVSFKGVQSAAETFEKMFHSELTLYISVPIGLIVGTIIGLVRNQTLETTLALCLQIVLLLASLVLLFFLVYAFARMKDPLFKTIQVPSPKIADEWMKERSGFISKVGKILRFLVPPPKPETTDQEQKDLDLACMVADLRKIYLYDAVHNVVLLVAFVAVTMGLSGISIDVKWLIASLLGLSLFFNQLPFALGQSALHEKVLERYEGAKRADIAEKLKKYSPLFPTFDFLAALFTTGTAGGVLYVLLDNFVKEALK